MFRYPGGKSKTSIKNKILSTFPKEYAEYRECMVGGGGVFKGVSISKKRWINDIDEDLISVYQSVQENVDEFVAKCKSIVDVESTFYDFKSNKEVDKAVRYYFLNRVNWGGRVNYNLPSRFYLSNPQGWKIIHTNEIFNFAKLLQDVRITSLNYPSLFNEDGENVLIYCDPPYVKNTELSRTSQLYSNNFTIQDHIDLAECIKTCKHKVCLSYDNHPLILDLYKQFNIINEQWAYCGTSSANGQLKSKKQGQELIITNY